MNIFVGGPITNMCDSTGIIREQFAIEIKMLLEYLSENEYNVFSAHEAEEYGKKTLEFTSDKILERDFSWMKECDLYIAYCPIEENELIRSDGINIELGWAYALDKPIILVCNSKVKSHFSTIVQGMIQNQVIEMFFYDIEDDLVSLIKKSMRKKKSEIF